MLEPEESNDPSSPAGDNAEAEYLRALEEIERRASSTGLKTERLTGENGAGVRLWFSDERVRNAVRLIRSLAHATELLSYDFEFFRLVPEYAATFDSRDGTVEARVMYAVRPLLGMAPQESILDGHRMTSPDGQALIEFGPADPFVSSMVSWRPSSGTPRPSTRVRFAGFGLTTPEAAKDLLDTVGVGVLFELDLTHDVSLRFARPVPIRPPMRRRHRSESSAPPEFPRNAYEREAIELYMYGREARGMPLLEFLAYYQAIEFFFPRYSEAALRDRIEKLVKDPRFSPHRDRDVGRLVDVLRDARGRGFGTEREQLRETLRSCVEATELAEFLSDENRIAHFGDKKSSLAVRPIPAPQREQDLRDAVAERVYQLRCKIVHTKDGGGSGEIDLLLPNSPEARLLTHDIDLVRMLAARVITASSSGLAL